MDRRVPRRPALGIPRKREEWFPLVLSQARTPEELVRSRGRPEREDFRGGELATGYYVGIASGELTDCLL